ncbi:MAG: SRPBCC family protein [Alphaproteobacteria bacterium]
MTALASSDADSRPEFTIKRVYDAPTSLVWAAWTEEAHIREWFGPNGFTSPGASVDLRPGGAYEVEMEGPNGWSQKAVYSIAEYTAGERLVLEASGGDRAADNYYRVNIVVEISDLDGRTQMVLTGFIMESQPGATGPLTGGEGPWSQSMDRLGERLRNIQ